MDRHFIQTGNIQFTLTEGGTVYIPYREVTPGAESQNLAHIEPSEQVLKDSMLEGGTAWGNEEVLAVLGAALDLRHPNDTCHVWTETEWAARKQELTEVEPEQQALVTAAQARLAAQK